MHERTKRLLESSDHYLDSWPWDGNFPPPLDERAIARFQKRINDTCGLSAGGAPNVRLIWPADPNPDISMIVTDGEKRARYCVYSHEYQCEKVSESGVVGVETITVDVVPPRFMLEEYSAQSKSYSHLFTVGHHDERCCGGSESIEGHLCHGLYSEPQDRDVERLQQLVTARERYFHVNPDEPMGYGEMQDWLSRIRTWREQAERVAKQQYKDAIISGLTPMRPRLFSGDPTVQKWGAHHFLSGHNKSGSPKNN